MAKVFFVREERIVEVPSGWTVLDAARKAGIEVHQAEEGHLCHHQVADCATCVVTIKEGASRLTPRTSLEVDAPEGMRLACQARVFGHVAVVTHGEVRFLPDTCAPAWGVFSGKNTGVPAKLLRRALRM